MEGVLGVGALRAALEGISGPLSTQALAMQLFGVYSGLVYFTPVLGGLIADRRIGQRNAVVLGIITVRRSACVIGRASVVAGLTRRGRFPVRKPDPTMSSRSALRKSRSDVITAWPALIAMALLAVMSLTIFQPVALYQVYNVMPIWLQRDVALSVGGFAVPPAWYQAAWGLTCVFGTPPVLWWWRRQAECGYPSDDLTKIRNGAWANTTVGVIGGLYVRTTPAAFWAGHAAIAVVVGLLVMVFGRQVTTALHATALRAPA